MVSIRIHLVIRRSDKFDQLSEIEKIEVDDRHCGLRQLIRVRDLYSLVFRIDAQYLIHQD